MVLLDFGIIRYVYFLDLLFGCFYKLGRLFGSPYSKDHNMLGSTSEPLLLETPKQSQNRRALITTTPKRNR